MVERGSDDAAWRRHYIDREAGKYGDLMWGLGGASLRCAMEMRGGEGLGRLAHGDGCLW